MDEDLKVLTESEIQDRLKDFEGWTYANDKIRKEFKLGSFSEVVEFLSKLAPFCDSIDHHPNVNIFYNKIIFEIQSYRAGHKVTERDFKVAKEIERLYKEK